MRVLSASGAAQLVAGPLARCPAVLPREPPRPCAHRPCCPLPPPPRPPQMRHVAAAISEMFHTGHMRLLREACRLEKLLLAAIYLETATRWECL